MCLQPITVIKAISVLGHLACKRRAADADWSLLCSPPFVFTSVIDTWVKPTKIKQKSPHTPKTEFLLGSYFTKTVQAHMVTQGESHWKVRYATSLVPLS